MSTCKVEGTSWKVPFLNTNKIESIIDKVHCQYITADNFRNFYKHIPTLI